MTGKALARLMAWEYRCQQCHRRMATEVFDYKFVCYLCRKALERNLVKRG